MSLRRQLPVYSPLPAGALLKGAGALLMGPGRSGRRVMEWLAREFGVDHPLLLDSGTSALALAMKASQAVHTTVLLPAYGCFDLVTAALQARVPVRWYDLDPATLGPNWRSLEGQLQGDVAAIVIAHFYGVPVDHRRARELAERAGALLIEDAAQGIGAMADDRPLGALGDLGVLSFGRGKGLTSGGGGALLPVTRAGRAALERLAPQLESAEGSTGSLVKSLAQWMLAHPSTYAIPASLPFLRLGETVFREPAPARPINSAALGILSETVDHVWKEADTRRANAARLIRRLSGKAMVPAGPIGRPGYLRLPVLLSDPVRFRAEGPAVRALGIMPGYPRVLPTLPGPTADDGSFPGSDELVQSLVTLPVHGRLRERDLTALEGWVDQLAK